MEYISTRLCLQSIVQSVGTVTTEQLKMFFRTAPDAEKVPYYIKEFIALRLFDYSKERDEVTWHTAPAVKEDIARRRVMAFHLVAYLGYENVREVLLLAYPSQMLVITQNNECYDLTVCLSEQEARVAFRTIRLYQVPGVDDDVNHIAIVRDEKVGKAVLAVKDAEFDSYCIFDENRIPQYFTE